GATAPIPSETGGGRGHPRGASGGGGGMSGDPSDLSVQAADTGDRNGEAAHPENPYYILAASPVADEQRRVLKQGDTLVLFDHLGDIRPAGLGEEGLFHDGTRYLSSLMLGLGRERPMFLSSTVREDNAVLAVDLTNPDVASDGRVVIPRGTLHIARTKFLWDGVCYEHLRIRNYQSQAVTASLSLHFDADFADIFEVRGTPRA